MALMDIPTIDPLMRALRRLLKPEGRFVFSVQHPAFNFNAARLVLEEENRDGALVETYSVKVTGYLHVPPRERGGDARRACSAPVLPQALKRAVQGLL
jgi:hypothetical protein